MQPTRTILAGCLAAAALVPAAGRAQAGPTETRLREALRTTTTQLRALEGERAAWQAREAELSGELEAARKGVAAARRAPPVKVDRAGQAELERRLAEQTAAAAKLSQSLAQCEAAARESSEAARVQGAERTRLTGERASMEERLAAAQAKNQRLYRVGKELIDWLSQKGVGRAIASREPFLGLKRVELENVAQDYEDKLLEERLNP